MMTQPKHYDYGGGFCGNCAANKRVVVIHDWFPASGTLIPNIIICKECLEQMLTDWPKN